MPFGTRQAARWRRCLCPFMGLSGTSHDQRRIRRSPELPHLLEAEASGLVREQILAEIEAVTETIVECRGVSPARYFGELAACSAIDARASSRWSPNLEAKVLLEVGRVAGLAVAQSPSEPRTALGRPGLHCTGHGPPRGLALRRRRRHRCSPVRGSSQGRQPKPACGWPSRPVPSGPPPNARSVDRGSANEQHRGC